MRFAFTLIELLITIILFSLLLATALYSFRFISINIRSINNTNPQMSMNYNLLRDSIGSIYPYIDTDIRKIDFSERYYFYFYGSNKKCRFVTKSGFFYNEITLVELSFKNNTVWYAEGKIFDKTIDYRNLNNLVLSKKIKIFNDIEEFNFEYSSKNIITSVYEKSIPDFIILKLKKNKHEFQYTFKLKAHNDLRLKKIIFRYLEGN